MSKTILTYDGNTRGASATSQSFVLARKDLATVTIPTRIIRRMPMLRARVNTLQLLIPPLIYIYGHKKD